MSAPNLEQILHLNEHAKVENERRLNQHSSMHSTNYQWYSILVINEHTSYQYDSPTNRIVLLADDWMH